MDLKKAGATAILVTMLFGLFGFAGTRILDNSTRITRLEQRQLSNKELLQEVRSDVKILLQRTSRGTP